MPQCDCSLFSCRNFAGMSAEETFMQRCLELAKMGQYTAAPNPMVGCVIVYQNEIIAEGYHHHAGGPHAEVVAISKVKDQELLKQSQLYVSLEPCAHFGRTPPCSDLIVEKGIPEVFMATRDYNAEVNGKGVAKLQSARIKVTEGILEQEAQKLNCKFFTFHAKKRPFISLKWAQSPDGIMDLQRSPMQKGVQWISQPETQVFSHQLRALHQAILVGRKTVEVDNPSLDTRAFKGKDPLRIILDPEYRLTDEHQVFRDNHYLRFSSKVKTEMDRLLKGPLYLFELVETLYQEGIQSILIEGGAKTLEGFIEADLWDEAWQIVGSQNLESGLKAPQLPNSPQESFMLAKDRILKYSNL